MVKDEKWIYEGETKLLVVPNGAEGPRCHITEPCRSLDFARDDEFLACRLGFTSGPDSSRVIADPIQCGKSVFSKTISGCDVEIPMCDKHVTNNSPNLAGSS